MWREKLIMRMRMHGLNILYLKVFDGRWYGVELYHYQEGYSHQSKFRYYELSRFLKGEIVPE